jgi:hypothetical protein
VRTGQTEKDSTGKDMTARTGNENRIKYYDGQFNHAGYGYHDMVL